jgi:N,N'-diacetylchitobiose phosphorylase
VQWILGIRPEIDGLRIDPCIPKNWPGFTMRRQFRGVTVKIEVKNPHGVSRGVQSLTVNRKVVMGNLVPLERLKEGARIVAVLG